ncbi:MAG: hypothetical protein K2M94_05975 [Paramuribaculum sp.]|nr:hypothetical protein [Paramuribaculum sp.]
MNFKELVETAKTSGLFTEKQMWLSVESMSDLLAELKKEHPQMFWDFMREQHGIMFGKHYMEEFARYDVSQMHYTDKEGKTRHEPHWSVEQAEDVMKTLQFPSGVTKWDWWVALCATHSDLCGVLDNEHIIKVAYAFYFKDADWDEDSKSGYSPCKVWEYFSCKYED